MKVWQLILMAFELISVTCSIGVQIILREYDFNNKKHPTFKEDDIMNVFPIVKHTNPKVCIVIFVHLSGSFLYCVVLKTPITIVFLFYI